ncbi:MAG TPA: hypothetical protein VFF62_05080 [Candidatus Nitrosocosmicus sp.]|nr:hypothetical protein [Candidatus Nitrosocosmicus sp.]
MAPTRERGAVSPGSRLARWETWVTVGGVLVLALVGVDIGLFERNRGIQAELAGRQQFLQKTQGLETLHRELVNAIASLVARDNDEDLRKILTDHGIGASAAPRPPGRP